MFRRILLAAAVLAATTLAMTPTDADARWGYRRAWRSPARVTVGYGPRIYTRDYVPRRYGNPLYYSARQRGYYFQGGRSMGLTVGPRARGYYRYGW